METVKDDRRNPLETLWLAREWARGQSREEVRFLHPFGRDSQQVISRVWENERNRVDF